MSVIRNTLLITGLAPAVALTIAWDAYWPMARSQPIRMDGKGLSNFSDGETAREGFAPAPTIELLQF